MSASSDLSTIRTKVRRVTGRLSPADMTDNELDFDINTYLIYDFPEQLRTRFLQTNYTFTLNANQDTYTFPSEQYVLLQNPIFCDGYYLNYYQDQVLFYAAWPKILQIQQVGTGNGANLSPTLANISGLPCLANTVMLTTTIGGQTVSYLDNGKGSFVSESFSITGITNAASAVITLSTLSSGISIGSQIIVSNVYGMTQINGQTLIVTAVSGLNVTVSLNTSTYGTYLSGGEVQRIQGSVNYNTGVLSMNWGTAPDSNAEINAHYYYYAAARPNSVLFYADQLIFRPVPDQAYKVEMQVYKKPTELLNNNQSPELRQWWQLIAYGAALKVFANTLDMESYQKCYPLFQEQEILAMRNTVDQKAQKKVITPFSDVPTQQVWPYDYYGV